jgi:4-amino-4-deoxy-L-arabinose transferase-like glycosyltransferase
MDVLTTEAERAQPDGQVVPQAAEMSMQRRWLLGLLGAALVVRIATLGAYPLMDNTEARYAEIARKIVETGDWLMPQFQYGVPFWSKPPLSMWATAIAYLALGVNEFSARLPSFLASLPLVWMTYSLAARRNGADAGLRAAVVLVTTPLFLVCSGAVMTDPALVLGTTLSMAAFWEAMTGTGRVARAWGYVFFAGLAIGLLAKGPVGVVLTLGPVGLWTIWKGGIGNVWRRLPWLSGLALTIALAVPWYVLAERRTPGFLDYFLIGEHWKRFTESGWKGDMFGSAHSRPRGTIWLYALASTLPWSALWIARLATARHAGAQPAPASPDDGWRTYLWLWMLAPAVFFTFAGNILFTYVLPGLPAFALLVGAAWDADGNGGFRGAAWRSAGLLIPVGFLVAALFVVPGVALTNSHKALVAEYFGKRASDVQRLIYVDEAPQSAEFYARGKVTIAHPADLGRYLHDAPRDFFALKENQNSLPEITARLAPIARFGRYTLFEEARQDSVAPR